MPAGELRSFGGLISGGGLRAPRTEASSVGSASRDNAAVFPTKAFRKFLGALANREATVLMDLGPVVGSNITFFGERLGCKIFIEDLLGDLDRHTREGRADAFAEFLKTRFPQADESVDGILCWDVFDYLDRAAAQAVARQLSRMLRTGGALLGFFATAETVNTSYKKFAIVDDHNLQHRPYGGSRSRQRVLLNRDIIKMFEGLLVSDSYLLQINTREILFRKPSYLGAHRATI